MMQASSSQEFSALDRANKQREVFHAKKMEELGSIMASFEEMIEAKKKDNELLEEEVVKLEQELKEEEAELEAQSKAAEEEMAKVLLVLMIISMQIKMMTSRMKLQVRLRRVMKRNKLAEQIKEQQELLVNLQEQVDANSFYAPVDFIMMIICWKNSRNYFAVSDNVFSLFKVCFISIINRWTHLSLELFPPLAE